jgi:hypothetical protein
MLIFMQHISVVKRLSMEVRPPAVAAVRQSSTANRVTPTNTMGILWSPCGRVSSLKCQVSSKSGGLHDRGLRDAGRGGRRRPNAQNEPNSVRPGADGGHSPPYQENRSISYLSAGVFRGKSCKTNPIWPGRGSAPEAKCAEQTQFVKGRNERKAGSLKRL